MSFLQGIRAGRREGNPSEQGYGRSGDGSLDQETAAGGLSCSVMAAAPVGSGS